MKEEITRDVNHSWFVVEQQEYGKDSYEVRMMTENQIPGLLSCACRQLDDQMQFCYEITGLSSLEELARGYKLKGEEIEAVIRHLCLAAVSIQDYLLNMQALDFCPEHIFTDRRFSRVFFCYLPGRNFNVQEEFQKLTEYLLTRLDHQDPGGVALGYGLYRYSMEEEFRLETLQQTLYLLMEKSKRVSRISGSQCQEELWKEQEEKQRHEQALRSFFEEENQNAGTKRISGKSIPLAAGGILCLAAGGWMWMNQMVYGGYFLIPGIACLIFSGVVLAVERKTEKETSETGTPLAVNEERPEELWETYSAAAESVETQWEEKETQFLPCGSEERGIRLRPMDMGAGEILRVYGKRPLLIGKRRETADLVVVSPTVSRIHARIRRDEAGWMLRDMNSTNGTYLNGVRLVGEAEESLQEGDEVRFAEKRYIVEME